MEQYEKKQDKQNLDVFTNVINEENQLQKDMIEKNKQ